MRVVAALLLVLLCSEARAESAWKPVQDQFRKMFPGKPPPVEVTPLPPVIPPELPPPPVIMLPEPEPEPPPPAIVWPAPVPPIPPPAVVPLPPQRDPRSSSMPKPKAPLRTRTKNHEPDPPGHPDYISCSDARQGVTMTCDQLKRWRWIYDGYTERKKANSQACLTAAERERIAACFK